MGQDLLMNRKIAARVLAPAATALIVGLVALSAAASTGSSATGWLDRPAAIPAVSTAQNPGIADCNSKDLSVRLARRGLLQFGTYGYVYSATNTTSHACYVSGRPSVKLAGKTAAGGPNVLDVEAGVLAPGASATFAIIQSARTSCTPAVTSKGALRTSAVTPDVEIGAQPAASKGTVLTSNCTETDVSQIGLTSAAPAPDPLSPLTVRMQTPASVRAGTTLRFAVTITNPTQAAIKLSPCPSYEVGISSARTLAYELNCSTPVILPGQTRTFDMQYAVPANTPAGLTKVGWFLLNPSRTGTGDVITITR